MENFNQNIEELYHKLTNISDYYKCGLCKNISINAHQTVCGANFCCKCVYDDLANCGINCPCGLHDYKLKINQQIFNRIISCRNKICFCECKINKMEEHLNYSSNLKMKNSSNDNVSEYDRINNKLNDNILSDNHNHIKILITLIENLGNEMRKLNEKIEENRLEIDILKEKDHRKEKLIESLKEGIKSMKGKNEDLEQQMEIGDRNLWCKFDKVDVEINKIHDNYAAINMELPKMDKECSEKLKIENINDYINKIDEFMKMKYDGMLWWQIGRICEISGGMRSQYFYDKKNPYKMRLGLRNFHDNFKIDLVLYSGCFDDNLQWPCRAKIAIDISALNNFSKYKCLEKSSIIERPDTNTPKCGDPITISYYDLKHTNLLDINCLLRCTVKFE